MEVDGFISTLDPHGSQLLYSTYYGMDGWDSLLQVNMDENRKVAITGIVNSGGFETVNPFQTDFDGAVDIVVIIWDEEIKLVSYLGGHMYDHPFEQVLSNGKLYLVGESSSSMFPVSADGYQRGMHGEADGII